MTITGDRGDSEEEKPKNKQINKINISFETGELIEGEASIGVEKFPRIRVVNKVQVTKSLRAFVMHVRGLDSVSDLGSLSLII